MSPFENIANDTKRQFLLSLNAKAAYSFYLLRRQPISVDLFRAIHRVITREDALSKYSTRKNRLSVVRTYPNGSYSKSHHWSSTIIYQQFNSKNQAHGLYEDWLLSSGEFAANRRCFYQNALQEQLEINFTYNNVYVDNCAAYYLQPRLPISAKIKLAQENAVNKESEDSDGSETGDVSSTSHSESSDED
jgi:hypothetical protein